MHVYKPECAVSHTEQKAKKERAKKSLLFLKEELKTWKRETQMTQLSSWRCAFLCELSVSAGYQMLQAVPDVRALRSDQSSMKQLAHSLHNTEGRKQRGSEGSEGWGAGREEEKIRNRDSQWGKEGKSRKWEKGKGSDGWRKKKNLSQVTAQWLNQDK